MNKIIYFVIALMAASVLSACGGTDDYDAYVASLKDREGRIDEISTHAEYVDFVLGFQHMADSFAALDVKLNPTQVDEIKQINLRITERISAKYASLALKPEKECQAETDSCRTVD